MLTDQQCNWGLDLKLFDKQIAKQSCDFVFFSKQQSHHPIKTERRGTVAVVIMKIRKANAGPLTNFEVLELLQSRGASNDPTRVMSLITPSEFKVFDYLFDSAARNQTRESINEFIKKSKEYQLAKAEVMNIINIRPSSEVELAPLIELEQRGLDDDKLTEIVEMVAQVLPPHPNQQKSDDEAAEDNTAEEAVGDDTAEVGDDNIAEKEMDAS